MLERAKPGAGSRLIRAPKLVGNRGLPDLDRAGNRRLAAVLHQAQVDRGIKGLMVASAYSGEGKTLTAANLAWTLSESIAAGCCWSSRPPSAHAARRLQIPNLEGLSDGLKSKTLRKMPLVELTRTCRCFRCRPRFGSGR